MTAGRSRTPARHRTRIHASCVLVGARAVLVRGAPGSGKSALVLELLGHDGPSRPVRLVADDAVDLLAAGGWLVATAPRAAAGLVEVRGVGIVPVAGERRALVGLLVDLVAPDAAPRLPEPDEARVEVAGVVLPRLALPVGAAGHACRVLAALDALAAGRRLPIVPE